MTHRAIDIYDGDANCLDDGTCAWEQDYNQPGDGFCPHTSNHRIICLDCSRYDDTTQSWPTTAQVPWPCPTVAATPQLDCAIWAGREQPTPEQMTLYLPMSDTARADLDENAPELAEPDDEPGGVL